MAAYLENTSIVPRAAASRGDICQLSTPGIAIVGGTLYVGMGGFAFSSGNSSTVNLNSIFGIPLNNSFPVHSSVSADSYYEISISSTSFPEAGVQGTILYTNTSLYFYDPVFPRDTTSIFTYNAETNTQRTLSVNGSDNYPFQNTQGGIASDPSSGRMFYTGHFEGTEGSDTSPPTAKRPWLQILYEDGRNNTVTWLEGAGGGPELYGAAMHYLRYGKEGILVAFGGLVPGNLTETRDFKNIYVFDISSQVWYLVEATGAFNDSQIPGPRQLFCTGLSAAPDSSTFQITMFGGLLSDESEIRNRIFTLIIPTFQWLEVTPRNLLSGTGDDSRWNHQCTVWQDNQMFVVGGHVSSASGNIYTDCEDNPPLLILDTNTFEWKDRFDPTQNASQPRAIFELVGGDANGGNTKKAPAAGFNNPALSTIFANVLPRITAPTSFVTAVEASPSTTTTSATTSLPTGGGLSSRSKVAIIAGSVSGGIVFLALIAGFIYYFWSRRRRLGYDLPPIVIGYDSNGNPVYNGSFGGIGHYSNNSFGGILGTPPVSEILGGVDHTLPIGGIAAR
ncbi:hypothetical protein TWF694_004309 [Orbilia ellipsospora]|uniref:Kelch repeat protein n=1 Tax=Orbilia ellipsospora TaxID=2528407 RepID=A0AAV9WYW1_9PEZI